jgi:hypothetical protein
VAIERRNTKQLKQLPADKSCEYTNSVVAHPTSEFMDFIAKHNIRFEDPAAQRQHDGAITIDARRLCSRRALNVWRWGMRIGNAEMLARLRPAHSDSAS